MRSFPVLATAAAVVCLAGITAAAVPAVRKIESYADRVIPDTVGKYVHDVTWSGLDRVIIATDQGLYSLNAKAGSPVEVLKGIPAPDGVPDPNAVSSDGKTVSAISWNSNSGFALRLADHKRLVAQRTMRFIPMDVALRGNRACFIGYATSPSTPDQTSAAAWCGSPSDSWTELRPLHLLSDEHARSLFRSSTGFFGGRVVIEPNGIVDVWTNAQAGVYRYGADGKLKEVVGRSLDDLVLESVKEIFGRFASDLENRYKLLLNVQPIADDIVALPDGPRIVVRIAEGDRITWQLWRPSPNGGVTEKIALGADRYGPFGHMRCDASTDYDIVCVGSHPSRADAGSAKTAQASPHLYFFRLRPRSK